MNPIFITSKGRPDATTFKTLSGSGLNVVVVVEKQDEAEYRSEVGKLPLNAQFLVLPEINRGLAYARQFALESARKQKIGFYWMLDDDIKGFYRTIGGKTVKAPAAEVIAEAEGRFSVLDNLGIGSLEYQQFAWNAKPGDVSRNSYCDVAVLINGRVSANYREIFKLKVDRDFTLSVLSGGRGTARLRDLSFSVPKNGSNKGGLCDTYGGGIEEEMSRLLEKAWPGIATFREKPNGRPDAKIDWRFFSKRHEA